MIIDGILFNLFVNSRNRQKNTHENKQQQQQGIKNWKMNFHWEKRNKNTITTLTNPNQPTNDKKGMLEVNIENVIIDGF